MNKSKIDWCDSTWNPVTGCLHGCEYCYARNIAKRFGCHATPDDEISVVIHPWEDSETGRKLPYPFDFIPTFHRYHLNDYISKKGRNIFVCSMADLFGDWVSDSWIEEVFKACEKAPQHNYLFLTKNPKRYIELVESGKLPQKDNMWYGSTVTAMEEYFSSKKAFNTFLSIEPMLSSISPSTISGVKWIIFGAETGHRKGKIIPKREWIEDIVNECRKANIPVFMKESLADIWGEPLIREFPKGLKR
ncbi:MAG: DUF5131 family protein [Lachnospiraceae bacterium]|nr:DUF5131 family protein [Lachnospiraceae bacterium]